MNKTNNIDNNLCSALFNTIVIRRPHLITMAQMDIAVYYDHDGHAIWLHDKNYYLFQIQMKNN